MASAEGDAHRQEIRRQYPHRRSAERGPDLAESFPRIVVRHRMRTAVVPAFTELHADPRGRLNVSHPSCAAPVLGDEPNDVVFARVADRRPPRYSRFAAGRFEECVSRWRDTKHERRFDEWVHGIPRQCGGDTPLLEKPRPREPKFVAVGARPDDHAQEVEKWRARPPAAREAEYRLEEVFHPERRPELDDEADGGLTRIPQGVRHAGWYHHDVTAHVGSFIAPDA